MLFLYQLFLSFRVRFGFIDIVDVCFVLPMAIFWNNLISRFSLFIFPRVQQLEFQSKLDNSWFKPSFSLSPNIVSSIHDVHLAKIIVNPDNFVYPTHRPQIICSLLRDNIFWSIDGENVSTAVNPCVALKLKWKLIEERRKDKGGK